MANGKWQMANGRKAFVVAFFLTFSIFHFPFSIASPTTQQASTQPAATMRQSFTDLASSDARKREDARVDLMGLTRSDLPALRDFVKENLPLAPAQTAALQEIVSHVYLAGSEESSDGGGAFLGLLNFANDFPAFGEGALEGVVVQTRMPGFCGYRFLQEGDVIENVVFAREVKPLARFGNLQIVVSQMQPGDTITLDVLRHGQSHRVTIPLDARPRALEKMPVGAIDDYVEQRKAQADEYWKKNFAPLVEKSLL